MTDREKALLGALFLLLALALSTEGSTRPVVAGTAFVMRGGGVVLLAKNLDGPVGEGFVCVNKKDVVKQAFGESPPARPRWTSKYGSVTFNQFGREFPFGGLNEAGLAIEDLGVPAAYPPAGGLPGLNEFQWVQYHLDTCRSVKEVIRSSSSLAVSPLLMGLHYLVADRKGNVAVIEFDDKKMSVYSGDALPVEVLSNDRYPESLSNLRLHRGFGGERRVSRGLDSSERFVRAAAALREYRWLGQRPLLDHAFVVLKSVAQEDTQWSVAYSLPRRMVFFKTKEHRRYKIISLERLDFSCRGPALVLSVTTESAGNLVRELAPWSLQENGRLLDSMFRALGERGVLEEVPPESLVQEMAAYPDRCRCRK
jgi:choloylglycine hydrolase